MQAKPNSLFNGVQIGTITYSFRGMPDQSGEATLKYVVDSGLSATELMDGPAENFLGSPNRGGAAVLAAPAGVPAAASGEAAPPPPQFRLIVERTAVQCRVPGRCPPAARGGGAGGGRGRGALTPERPAARLKSAPEDHARSGGPRVDGQVQPSSARCTTTRA